MTLQRQSEKAILLIIKEETLKQADNEKCLRAQEILKEMFIELYESCTKVTNVPKP